jgi:hypothetical protein
MLFADFLESTKTWVMGNLPVAVGGAVAALVLLFLLANAALRARRRELDPSKLVPASAGTSLTEKSLKRVPRTRGKRQRFY